MILGVGWTFLTRFVNTFGEIKAAGGGGGCRAGARGKRGAPAPGNFELPVLLKMTNTLSLHGSQ